MKCHKSGCTLSAKFNIQGSENGKFCFKHREDGMIHIRQNFCRYCTRQAKYGYTFGKSLACSEHKKKDMVDVKHRKCAHPECTTNPYFNYKGEKCGLYCDKHKLKDMINVKHQRCAHPDCPTTPNYNFENEKRGKYCREHAKQGMIDVIHKMCAHIGCKKRPTRNLPSKTTPLYCQKHSSPEMIDVVSKRCAHNGCTNFPTCNLPDTKSALYCSAHALSGMVCVVGKRCKTPLCDIQIKNKKYDNYCLRCYMFNYPDKPVSRNYKIKEKHVTDSVQEILKSKGYNHEFILDKPIQGGCSKKRPDMFLDLFTHVIVVEVDEEQHKNEEYTSCETNWLTSIFSDVAERPTIFLRFNPDKYTKDNKKYKSCFKLTEHGIRVLSCKKEFAERIDNLTKRVLHYIENPPEKLMTVEYLYYDNI